ncbi:hypothetical protein JCM21531_4511 [Acetivibrio straminisolvens JCM 21531]|uniref:Uncharacterized protein n=1 Tax=Acetivibrio straminisolvens JCM 21531 TaxID=1294263 RepID=W4VDI8_9FIRM|nr:hypothetical protein JCM21531_4511 [Acetivibrio straminisolvens JCM 21531]
MQTIISLEIAYILMKMEYTKMQIIMEELVKSKRPIDGQFALDNSVEIKDASKSRRE